MLSLQELCCRSIVTTLKTVHDIDRLPLPGRLQLQLKSFADSAQLTGANTLRRCNQHHKRSGSDMMNFKRNGGLLSSNSFVSPLFNKLTNRRRRATVTLPPQPATAVPSTTTASNAVDVGQPQNNDQQSANGIHVVETLHNTNNSTRHQQQRHILRSASNRNGHSCTLM